MEHSTKVYLVGLIGSGLASLLCHSLRIRVAGREYVRRLTAAGVPKIYAFWHRTLLPLAWGWQDDAYAIVSRSKDGDYAAEIARRFGHRSVRGSTSASSAAALRRLLRLAGSGVNLAITPDGPRGPRETVSPGVVAVARIARIPVLPMGFYARRRLELPSWDRFVVPLPFSAAAIGFAEPVWIDGREDAGTAGERVRAAIDRANENARRLVEEG